MSEDLINFQKIAWHIKEKTSKGAANEGKG
jgi:hypothetical protein